MMHNTVHNTVRICIHAQSPKTGAEGTHMMHNTVHMYACAIMHTAQRKGRRRGQRRQEVACQHTNNYRAPSSTRPGRRLLPCLTALTSALSSSARRPLSSLSSPVGLELLLDGVQRQAAVVVQAEVPHEDAHCAADLGELLGVLQLTGIRMVLLRAEAGACVSTLKPRRQSLMRKGQRLRLPGRPVGLGAWPVRGQAFGMLQQGY